MLVKLNPGANIINPMAQGANAAAHRAERNRQ
jgi:hypothetical protein